MELIRKVDLLTKEKEQKSTELNNKLKYLDAHQALDVFLKLSNKLSDVKSKRDNLLKFEALFDKYKEENRTIDKKQIEDSEKTELFLKDAKEVIAQTNIFFRLLAKRFYPNSAAGIRVENNEGKNQIRYNIEAKIEADKSDGIGNVKIFCYDMALLLKGFTHNINFLFHDSRLLDGIDPRQKHELFLVLDDYIKDANKQYILSVNQNQLDEIRSLFATPEEYKRIITNNIILNLKDNSAAEKLLGVQVDLDYD